MGTLLRSPFKDWCWLGRETRNGYFDPQVYCGKLKTSAVETRDYYPYSPLSQLCVTKVIYDFTYPDARM